MTDADTGARNPALNVEDIVDVRRRARTAKGSALTLDSELEKEYLRRNE